MNPQEPTNAPLRGEAAAPLQPAGSTSAPLTPWQEKRFRRRQEQLRRVHELLARGYNRIAAASEAGISSTTLWVLERRVAEFGLAGLVPRKGNGRPPSIDPALYTPAVVSELQRLAVKLGGPRAAARAFANHPACPPLLADYIRARRSIPGRLRLLIGFRRYSRPIRLAGDFGQIEGLPIQPRVAA
jgi:transposase